MPSSSGVTGSPFSSTPRKTSLKEFHLHAVWAPCIQVLCVVTYLFCLTCACMHTHSAFKISFQQQQQQQNIIMWFHPSHSLISNPTIKSSQINMDSLCHLPLSSQCGMEPAQQVSVESQTTAKGHFITLQVLENVAAQARSQSQSLQSFKHTMLTASSFNLKCLNTKSFWSGKWASWTRWPSILVYHRLWTWSCGQQNSMTQILKQFVCWCCFKWSQCTCVKHL